MANEGPNDKKAVDLTDPDATEKIADEDLEKVVGGLTRTTLQTGGAATRTTAGQVGNTVTGGGLQDKLSSDVGNDTLFAGLVGDQFKK